ncbi:MAG: hypothetical protein ABI182_07535 [Candidatus Baltobacteraceae bacterium]
MRAVMIVFALLAVAGCAAKAPSVGPQILSVGDRGPMPWPSAAVEPSDALPRILHIHLNADVVRPGSVWSGRIATSTNVASVEIRTELFSFNAERIAFGQFSFSQQIVDLPSVFQRGYVLRVIARNTAGVRAEQDIPFRFR